jgi:hypothetical protein
MVPPSLLAQALWAMYNSLRWVITSVTDHLTGPRNHISFLLLTLALTIFAVAPLAYPGYLQVHSGFIPVYNLADLGGRAPRLNWTPGVATLYDPLRGDGLLTYYLALPVVWLGGSALLGVKIIFSMALVLGAVGVYVWLRPKLGPAGATLAALVYTYLPYHLAVVYVRGAWGEALFLGLLPWALAAGTSPKTWGTMAASSVWWATQVILVWALLGLAQPGLTIWALLVFVVWAIWVDHGDRSSALSDRVGRPYTSLLAALVGTGAALLLTFLITGFSFPSSPIHFFEHFVLPAQLVSAYWGFGASQPGWDDRLALGLGFAALGLGMLALILAASGSHVKPGERSSQPVLPSPLRIFLLALALTLLLLGPSAPLWRLTGLANTLTYPWQLLGLIGLLLSVLAGTSISLDRRLAALPTYTGLITLTLLASYSYLEPRFTQLEPGLRPLAAWDDNHLVLLAYDTSVEIASAAAGLPGSTLGRLPLADYGPPQPGDTLHLTLTWQATRPFDQDLKLFAHLLDPSGQVIAQADPLAGQGAGPEGEDYFTSQWDPGELIANDVAISIRSGAPPGPYRLALGLYDGATLERLPVKGSEDGSVIIDVGKGG